MTYWRLIDNKETQMTYDDALCSLLSIFKDSDLTRDFLTIPNKIPCRFGVLLVKDENGNTSNKFYQVPNGNEYDENGKRL